LPFFNRNEGGIARAEAERRAADARLASTTLAVRLDVQRALNAVETNRARVDYIEREYLTNAQESRDIVLASYRLGVANLIDFLDAQRAFRDTQRIYNRALFDQRVSVFELAAADGRPEAPPEGGRR
jgi:cobalt-zinc-cadmium efflux system outer membrane protein